MYASCEKRRGASVYKIFRFTVGGFAALQWCGGVLTRTASARRMHHFEIALDRYY
jgi:hypothetical protein